jgi:ankyrin repeat protein
LAEALGEETVAAAPSPQAAKFATPIGKLLRAAARGEVDTVDALLADDPSLANAFGQHPLWGGRPQPLHVAAEWGRLPVVERLLAAGADPRHRARSYHDWAPLHLALDNHHPDTATALIEAGADVDVWAAAQLGDLARLQALLEADPALANTHGPNLSTPLHLVTTVDAARLLLDSGADPLAKDRYGATPARMGARAERTHPVTRLLAGVTGEGDIYLATALDEADRVAAYLDGDAELANAQSFLDDPVTNYTGGTALHVAAMNARAGIATTLLDRGADPNARSRVGHLPLHATAMNPRGAEVARVLLARGADPDLTDTRQGTTPASWAAFYRNDAVRAVLTGAPSA